MNYSNFIKILTFQQILFYLSSMGNETIGYYTTIQKLGKGLYGKTRLSESIDHYPLAIKIYELAQPQNIQTVIKQVKSYLHFQSKYIVKIIDIIEIDEKKFSIIMHYHKQGNITSSKKVYSIKQALLEMKELATSLKYLHIDRKIAHKNLKPSNIFRQDNLYQLSDITCPMFTKLRLRFVAGAFDYMAKEVFDPGASFASDIWALGIIFLELIFGRSIRQLENLQGLEKPSLIKTEYPSTALINSIPDDDLRYLIHKMLETSPLERMDIKQVFQFLSNLKLSKSEEALNSPIRQETSETKKLQAIKQFTFSFDHQHPQYSKFSQLKNTIRRVDNGSKRYQVVARQSIPYGKWKISFRILNYGDNNEDVVIGLLTEERRKEPMSGDIDQPHAVAYWSSKSNRKGNLCENGVWDSTSLPYLRQKEGLLTMLIDTVDRDIEWWIDGALASVSSLASGFWSEQFYVFLGLKGKDCEIQIVSPS